MNEKTAKVTLSCLLHDIGKTVCRAGISEETSPERAGSSFLGELYEDKDIIDSVRFQDRAKLLKADLPADSSAYITYIADRIASGADFKCGDNSGEERASGQLLPISSIFNLIDGRNQYFTCSLKPLTDQINYPSESEKTVGKTDYENLLVGLREKLKPVKMKEESINFLLSVLEEYFSFVPSSTDKKETADISLYDHCKITAAIGSCVSEYLIDNAVTDYRTELLEHDRFFLEKKSFIMFSGDFSGIQGFIFNVIAEGALKRLRSRSFFLEMLMEHIVDWILEACGVSRTNLLYSGGGHCYILLPNTAAVIKKLEGIKKRLNGWLLDNFGAKLYFAGSYTQCSANELMNQPAPQAPYEEIYRRLGSKLSKEKMHRYSAQDMMELNKPAKASGGRECRICGTETDLCEDDDICRWCSRFYQISSALISKEQIITVTDHKPGNFPYLVFPKDAKEEYYCFTNREEARELQKSGEVKRIYTKNRLSTDFISSINLDMGDYVYDSRIEELLDKNGLNRLAVLRADVDNFGQAFIAGFVRKDEPLEQRNRFNTLSRTAALSRQMSLFFKYYLNFILEGREEANNQEKGNETRRKKRVVTVYSGGDDLFLIGNFCDILEAAVDIRKCFDRYTCNALTISFGVGIYPVKYPLYKAALETAALEELAKQNEGKNSISLFTTKENHTYQFGRFRDVVLGEKYNLIKSFFDFNPSEQERGNAFLYHMLELLKNSGERINIARYAYILARLEPVKGSESYRKLYLGFSKNMYAWILNREDRNELATAIDIYIYLSRKRSDI